ncbi:ComN-like post-transcriptional regulator [Ureibacillus xyleni]|uniref:ComN-like post-transcriptional regulator n=1 Tax=Ureibacillus xyleni TaxID=614648 RepID=A0A285S5K1_9BACL|nr:post-transcriptional regulator [Ureibacillus xyleni]SOC02448.1 ComN-like post-transcriptional regulator [Ureibacillus xyleni]
MIQYEELYKKVLPVLESKLEEIKYYEYDSITKEDIWNFCIKKKWRKQIIEEIHLHEIVATIFTIKASDIVSHFQIQQFQAVDWFSEINNDELKDLLNPKASETEK